MPASTLLSISGEVHRRVRALRSTGLSVPRISGRRFTGCIGLRSQRVTRRTLRQQQGVRSQQRSIPILCCKLKTKERRGALGGKAPYLCTARSTGRSTGGSLRGVCVAVDMSQGAAGLASRLWTGSLRHRLWRPYYVLVPKAFFSPYYGIPPTVSEEQHGRRYRAGPPRRFTFPVV